MSIKLKNIIYKNYERSVQIDDVDMIVKLIKNSGVDISNIADNTFFPVRGLKADAYFHIVNPSRYIRKSKHASNIYTLLMDNSPYWKDYPKRSKSIICATSINKAYSYGSVFKVIPLDKDAKFGVCPKDDIWWSFRNTLGGNHLSQFNNVLVAVYNTAVHVLGAKHRDNLYIYAMEIDEFSDLKKIFDFLNKHKKSMLQVMENNMQDQKNDYIDAMNFLIKWAENPVVNIEEYLFSELSPEKNGFDLIYRYKSDAKFPKNVEVWTDSDCLLMPYDLNNTDVRKVFRKLGLKVDKLTDMDDEYYD
jgi:hypothetical protein